MATDLPQTTELAIERAQEAVEAAEAALWWTLCAALDEGYDAEQIGAVIGISRSHLYRLVRPLRGPGRNTR